jgi:hypothetical protein
MRFRIAPYSLLGSEKRPAARKKEKNAAVPLGLGSRVELLLKALAPATDAGCRFNWDF